MNTHWHSCIPRFALICHLMVIVCSLLAVGAPRANASTFRLEKYVESDDVVDAAGATFFSGTFDLKALDDRGELFIKGTVLDPVLIARTGLFVVTTSSWREIAHEPLNVGLFGDSRPSVNAGGQGAFRRYLLGGASGDQYVRTLTVLQSDGTLVDVLKQGDVFGPDGGRVDDISILPSVNGAGDVGLTVYSPVVGVKDEYFVGYYSAGEFHRLVAHRDPAPGGGILWLNIGPVPPVWLNDRRQALFYAIVQDGTNNLRAGTFRATEAGIEKIVLAGDVLATGHSIQADTAPRGTMNNSGDVAYEAALDGSAEYGVFVDRDRQVAKIYVVGDASPLGGPFLGLQGHRLGEGPYLSIPTVNDRGSVLFKGVAKTAKGKARVALFRYSPARGIEKVVAVGDRMANGKRVHEVGTYALNNLDQIAFSVTFKSHRRITEGIYLATPGD